MKKNKLSTKNNSYTAMLKKDFKINKSLYIMVLPVIIFYLLFHYVPMYGAIIAFKNFKPQLGIWGSNWVGLKHFVDFFNGYYFLNILGNTLRISFATLIFGFPAPILLALLLNEVKCMKLKKTIQTISYLPHFISIVVAVGLLDVVEAGAFLFQMGNRRGTAGFGSHIDAADALQDAGDAFQPCAVERGVYD